MAKFTSHFYSPTTQGCLDQKRSQRTEASQKDLQGSFQNRVIMIIGYITSFLINSLNSFEECGQVPLNIPSNHHFHCHDGLWNKPSGKL